MSELELQVSYQAVAQATAGPVRRLLAAFLVGYEGHTRAAYAQDLTD